MLIVRAGPSGKVIRPVPGNGALWAPASGSLALTLLAAPHPPGVYTFSIGVVVLTAAAAGTFTLRSTWSMPVTGAFTFDWSTNAPLTIVGNGFLAPRHVVSTGALPITMTLIPAGVVGTPNVYVNVPMDNRFGLLPAGFP
jgi:hypothetical protein